MAQLLNTVLIVVMALNLLALGAGRLVSVVRIVAVQGALLGLMPLMLHGSHSLAILMTVIVTVALKGLVIPGMMNRALRDLRIKREVEPLIGLQYSVVVGALGTALALLFADRLPLAPQHVGALIVPASAATILTGFILLITRFKAISQAMGYLILENGIFIFGLLLVDAMPFVIEMGTLLDLFVGIFVICIIVNHINRAFASTDTRLLATLKE